MINIISWQPLKIKPLVGFLCKFVIYCMTKALFSSPKILQNFSDSPSHRIFRRMHGVLNIDEKIKTNYTVWSELTRQIF